jgi:O-acetyl-ADP-ribose deacetylase (regulator of RNase III)
MITHKYNSDITKVDRGIIVHGCNAQGVMGSGVAKQLRAKYPQIFEDYVAHLELCKIEDVPVLGFVSYTQVSKELYIANAITQEFYGRDGKQYVDYEALSTCLTSVADLAQQWKMPVHIPYLIGAGLGGGDEKIILEIVEKTMYNTDCILHHFK